MPWRPWRRGAPPPDRRIRLTVRLRLALLSAATAVFAGTLALGVTYALLLPATVRFIGFGGVGVDVRSSSAAQLTVVHPGCPAALEALGALLNGGALTQARASAIATAQAAAQAACSHPVPLPSDVAGTGVEQSGVVPSGDTACKSALNALAAMVQRGASPNAPAPSAVADAQRAAQAACNLPIPGKNATFVVQARTISAATHADDLHRLLVRGGIALAALALLALAAGWWIAGRILRPLQVMTRRAQQLSAQIPLGRIRLAGPRDELKELGDTFDRLLERLDAALAADRRFVANASHELRTPLAIQETLLDVALADPAADAESLREAAERVRQVNRRSKRLIEGLLTLARSQQGLGRWEPADLATIAADAADESAPEAADRGVRIETDLHEAPVRGDPVLLDRLVGNLVENAVRYNRPGGWVQVRTATRGQRSELTVENTGPVVDPAEVEALFEPFRRGARDRTESHRGAGLGLSIVRAVAAAHAGTVEAQARPDGGLTVTASLPLAEDR